MKVYIITSLASFISGILVSAFFSHLKVTRMIKRTVGYVEDRRAAEENAAQATRVVTARIGHRGPQARP